jgi:hypothetical protein
LLLEFKTLLKSLVNGFHNFRTENLTIFHGAMASFSLFKAQETHFACNDSKHFSSKNVLFTAVSLVNHNFIEIKSFNLADGGVKFS